MAIGQGAGELRRPDHQGVDAERLRAHRLRIVGCHPGGDVVDDGQHALGVRAPGGIRAAGDLVEQGGGRAAVLGAVAMADREVFPQELFGSGVAGCRRAQALALLAELVGDRGDDQVVLGVEVGVERAVGQSRVGHERGDPRAVDAVGLEPAPGRLDDPPPRHLLALSPVSHHTLLHPPATRVDHPPIRLRVRP